MQFMKDSKEMFGHLAMAIPDMSAGVSAMDMIGQSVVYEVSSLRSIISKRDDRMKVNIPLPVPYVWSEYYPGCKITF